MQQKTLVEKALIFFSEMFDPSEGEFIINAPSGNIAYIGPPLMERYNKRISGYYLENPGVVIERSAYGVISTREVKR